MSEQIKNLSIVTWNINGVCNKLENRKVREVLQSYDIICLNETKTSANFSLPGYVTYTSSGENLNRGGCAVLLKNPISTAIVEIECSKTDYVYFRLKGCPDVMFVSCYIAPKSSPYYGVDMVADLNTLMNMYPERRFVIFGDTNSRFATLRHMLLECALLRIISGFALYRLPRYAKNPE